MAKRALQHLDRVDWAFVIVKVSLGIMWPVFYFSGDSVRPAGTGGLFLWLWCAFTVVGFVVSLSGLIMAAQPRRFRIPGRQIEIAGIWLFAGGPVCYGIIQSGLWVSTGDALRGAQVSLAIGLTASLVARVFIVKDGVRRAAIRTEDGA
ncbi:hypothetical protein LJ753_16880 [Arthrobacter sp. zg-Y20]|uniref:hypothetical protein n=1 Tax=unclassified Arthrobacter TaxID=235627 RepID=UPI001D1581C3|nr:MULTISPECIES: hypothetical protein [unclassified Arthrobacter]MCC3277541.1 hypothetical protein [Arthrobacter sp. zg-Y20]MDK1317699.1 hypothetical protein [Arthrobacter sp. zg.Y20]WIB07042.1 hypothetical protein QNO06_04760 [Arthrobacter sp. zg-Y20]